MTDSMHLYCKFGYEDQQNSEAAAICRGRPFQRRRNDTVDCFAACIYIPELRRANWKTITPVSSKDSSMSSSKVPAGGIGKTRAATAKEREKERLREAIDANLSPEKARSANAQSSIATKTVDSDTSASEGDQGQSVQTQSKPEYDAMEGISHEPLSEAQADSSLLDASGSQSSKSTDDAVPTTYKPDTSGITDADQNLELLADFDSLSLENGPSGVVDGFGGKARSAFCILRDGPRNAPLYHFTRTNGFNTQGFKNLSYHRITLLHYENEKGEKVWVYTKENAQGIVGIAIEVRRNNRDYKRNPQVWVKIKWKNIKPEHKMLLIKLDPDDVSKRHSSWIPKSDLVRLVGRKAAEARISEAWENQENRHLNYLKNMGLMVDRSPTPCPLDVFAERREQREGSPGQSPSHMTPGRVESSSASGLNALRAQPHETVIKEEPKEDANLFVPPVSPVTPPSGPSNAASRESEQKQVQGPLRFSYDAFLEGVKKREKWHRLSEEDQERKLAEAEVRYDRYREMRIRKGDIEVDEE